MSKTVTVRWTVDGAKVTDEYVLAGASEYGHDAVSVNAAAKRLRAWGYKVERIPDEEVTVR